MAKEIIKSDCIMCINSCGIKATVDDGKLVKVEGLEEHLSRNEGRLALRFVVDGTVWHTLLTQERSHRRAVDRPAQPHAGSLRWPGDSSGERANCPAYRRQRLPLER